MNNSKIFQIALAGLVIFLIAYSMEQMIQKVHLWILRLTTGLHNKLGFFPVFEMHQNIFMLISLGLIVTVIVFAALVFLDLSWVRTAMIFIALFGLLLGIAPIFLSIYFGTYFPGSYSAGGLILCSVVLLLTRNSFHLPEFEDDHR